LVNYERIISRAGTPASRPGKPIDNAYIESFNSRFREECLNINWFLSLENAREKIEEWRQHYNQVRPHGALGNLAPTVFMAAGVVN
jgi:putative transposase